MEQGAYFALLREKMQKIMEKFVYMEETPGESAQPPKIMGKCVCTGEESEAKARLRHLFHNQTVSVASLAPEFQDWNDWTVECVENEDWAGLCRVINQRGKGDMMPCIYGSYTHEKNFHCALECLVCGNVPAIERLLPPDLTKVKNGYMALFPVAAHLMIGLWYKDQGVLEWAVPEAEALLGTKKLSGMEKAMISFLLDLVSGDMEKGSQDLLAVCKSAGRDKRYVLGVRPFCTYAHGLYCLAQLLLPEEVFDTLEMPAYKNFLPAFAQWRRENPNPDRSLWIRYPEDLEILNQIYTAPPARLVLFQPLLDNPNVKPRERQQWMSHGMKWVDNYVEELWNMGVGQG